MTDALSLAVFVDRDGTIMEDWIAEDFPRATVAPKQFLS